MVLKPAVEDACSRKSMYAAILRRYEHTQVKRKSRSPVPWHRMATNRCQILPLFGNPPAVTNQ
jgi:hypothetical protein